MLMPPFELHHPGSVQEAADLAASLMEKGEAFDWVAGGTDAPELQVEDQSETSRHFPGRH